MNDPKGLSVLVHTAVGVVETLQRLANDVHAELERKRHLGAAAPPQEIVQIEPLDVLHRDEEPLVRAAEIEDLHHVRVAQARREFCLVNEHVTERRVRSELGENLLYDAPSRGAELGLLAREVNLGHPSPPDEIEDQIAPERARQDDAGSSR